MNNELLVRYSSHDLNSELLVRYSDGGLNKEPFNDRTALNHLNTELVRYSDPHCIRSNVLTLSTQVINVINVTELIVVYLDQLWGAACTWKLVEILFSAVFNLFCSFQTFFSDFMPEITKKLVKLNVFFSYFAYSSKLGDMQKLVDSLRVYPKIVFFGWFLLFKTFFVIFWLISVFFR